MLSFIVGATAMDTDTAGTSGNSNSSQGNGTDVLRAAHPEDTPHGYADSPETLKLVFSLALVAFALAMGWACRKMSDHFADKELAKANAVAAASAAAEAEEERLKLADNADDDTRPAAAGSPKHQTVVRFQQDRGGEQGKSTKMREKLKAVEMIGKIRFERAKQDDAVGGDEGDEEEGAEKREEEEEDGIDNMIEQIINGKPGQTAAPPSKQASADSTVDGESGCGDQAVTGDRASWVKQQSSFSWGESSGISKAGTSGDDGSGGDGSTEVDVDTTPEGSGPSTPRPAAAGTTRGGWSIVADIIRRLHLIRNIRKPPNKIESENAFTTSQPSDNVAATHDYSRAPPKAPTVDPEDV